MKYFLYGVGCAFWSWPVVADTCKGFILFYLIIVFDGPCVSFKCKSGLLKIRITKLPLYLETIWVRNCFCRVGITWEVKLRGTSFEEVLWVAGVTALEVSHFLLSVLFPSSILWRKSANSKHSYVPTFLRTELLQLWKQTYVRSLAGKCNSL